MQYINIIISIIFCLWYLIPFYISIKRWFIGVPSIQVVYPFEIGNLKYYYIFYFLLFVFLLYKIICFYFVYKNKEFYILKIINKWLQKPWDFIENKIWRQFDARFDFVEYLVFNFFNKKYKLFNKEYFFLELYYYFFIIWMYFSIIVSIVVLYVEVLWVYKIYYIYYCLCLLLINRILYFILNRFISFYNNVINNYLCDYIKVSREILTKEEVYSIAKHTLYFELNSFFDFDEERFRLIYYHYNEEDNLYYFDVYAFNIDTKSQSVQDQFKFYCEYHNLFFVTLKEVVNVENEHYFIEFINLFIKGTCDLINPILQEKDFLVYNVKKQIMKNMLIISIMRVSAILIILNIVFYLNI